ncbi:class I SAM-dependent methyltransferase [Anaerococcus sp. AGMB00486]|uniref:Class I SAM-dependent methyltransferase n=3 Tax=Anaerococcus TaxID=165779 RepID=A0ABX2N9L7_9FIRM|nr:MULTISPECIES: class I SAM-dependent methyltransferase [Anaerococcus]MDY3006816.1 class I SAM-dependent methyltransferase [Anaerococcus porci]MSS78271.1 16S rRNA (cytosine(1402)-N(4))-methyltransferase [Anaerococcus porci]NVF11385.1 class I SAM-dependent methyltransferase [Anaerococcus faecalis]
MTYTEINNPVKLAHLIIKERIDKNIRACDMTAGNGKDSEFILKNLNPRMLYSFDIQKKAMENTKNLIGSCPNFKFILDSHDNIDKYIYEKIDLFIFNLGYLPRGDKSITTNYKTVIRALKKSLKLLNHNGLIIICVYPGHESGRLEGEFLEEFMENLDQKIYQVIKYDFLNQVNNPPYLISLRKL